MYILILDRRCSNLYFYRMEMKTFGGGIFLIVGWCLSVPGEGDRRVMFHVTISVDPFWRWQGCGAVVWGYNQDYPQGALRSGANLYFLENCMKPIDNRFLHMTYQIEAWNLLYKIEIVWWCLSGCNGLKNFPQMPKIAYVGGFLPFLDPLHTIKTFSTRISHRNFLQDFPGRIFRKIFPQGFPARFSCKNFLQEFPARFSRKIFPSWILIGWLPITLFQMLNFHQSLLC